MKKRITDSKLPLVLHPKPLISVIG